MIGENECGMVIIVLSLPPSLTPSSSLHIFCSCKQLAWVPYTTTTASDDGNAWGLGPEKYGLSAVPPSYRKPLSPYPHSLLASSSRADAVSYSRGGIRGGSGGGDGGVVRHWVMWLAGYVAY